MDQFLTESRPSPRGFSRPRRRDEGRTQTASQARLLRVIGATFDVCPDDLCAATRGRSDVALARQIGMYLARVTLGMTLADAGLLFFRDRTTAAHACRVVEDLRDDIQFDTLLDTMEAFVLHSDVDFRSGR